MFDSRGNNMFLLMVGLCLITLTICITILMLKGKIQLYSPYKDDETEPPPKGQIPTN